MRRRRYRFRGWRLRRARHRPADDVRADRRHGLPRRRLSRGLRARARRGGVLRPGRLQLPLRHPCRDHHGRSRNRRGAAHGLLFGGGCGAGDQPARGRRPAPRGRRPGHRPGAAGGCALRPGVGPASLRLVHGLRATARRRSARLRARQPRDADRDQPARGQGRGRGSAPAGRRPRSATPFSMRSGTWASAMSRCRSRPSASGAQFV